MRVDVALVERGFLPSRAKAREAIEAGLVALDGVPVARPSDLVPPGADLRAAPPYPWVSRGGVKLAAALDAFAIDPAGLDCLDVGASTGGFTDVLLARGAAHVTSVDVGSGQLHPRLVADPRVTSLEEMDIRSAPPPGSTIDFAVVDVSFISLRLVLPALMAWMRKRSQLVALIKPQFEVGRGDVGRGGIVRNPAAKAAAVSGIVARLVEEGWQVAPPVASPIAGRDGNEEFLIAAGRG